MWGTAYERYGQAFLASFFRHWPKATELVVFTDRIFTAAEMPEGRQVMLSSIPTYEDFKERWGFDKGANGYEPPARARVNAAGYSWRHDAVKWMPQAVVPEVAADGLRDGDLLVWLDADVETIADVPRDWIDSLLGVADVACLQRTPWHSEIGFYAVRLGMRTRLFLQIFAEIYATSEVFRMPEHHSGFVFDRALERVGPVKIRNLSPGLRGHVWPNVPELSKYTVHKKGKRKDEGRRE